MQKCISHNAYFGHSESILMTMLFDKDEKINADALSLIGNKMSQFPSNTTSIRKFSLPDINFQTNCYRDLIDWNQDVTIPPCGRVMSLLVRSKKGLKKMVKSSVISKRWEGLLK